MWASAPKNWHTRRDVSRAAKSGAWTVTVAATLLLLAAVAAYFSTPRAAERFQVEGGVLLRLEGSDFGTVWNSDHYVCTARLVNISDEELSVLAIETSCGCTSVEPQAFSLSPEAAQSLTFQMDLTERRPPPIEQFEREFGVTIYVYTGDEEAASVRHHFSMSGRVRDAIHFPSVIEYGAADRLVEGRTPPRRHVKVNTLTPVAELRTDIGTPDVRVDVVRDAEAESAFQLSVALSDDVPVGEFEYELRLQPVTVDGTELPSLPLRVRGVKELDVISTPSRLRFIVTENNLPAETVTLQSRSGKEFRVKATEASGVSVGPRLSDPAPVHEFTVRPVENPADGRRCSATFVLETDSGVRTLVVPVSVYNTTSSREAGSEGQ